MFHLTLITVGKLKNTSIKSLADDYQKRLKRHGRFKTVEFADDTVEGEGRRILEYLNKQTQAKIFILAEEGQTLSSESFAKELEALQGRHAIFVIGGAFGLSTKVKVKAHNLFALSPMTLTHELAQMLLCEQIYRGISILNGSKYHH
ncbi:23S rRNA (pseudouridine(1915)-N(3))-methyltransferase RlmH [Opitutae bacterium]|nr:23S rRNA (pseudouridine(1915)-N(3))-methyltransferase RlmH [Opitutae bacterium]